MSASLILRTISAGGMASLVNPIIAERTSNNWVMQSRVDSRLPCWLKMVSSTFAGKMSSIVWLRISVARNILSINWFAFSEVTVDTLNSPYAMRYSLKKSDTRFSDSNGVIVLGNRVLQ